MEGRGRARGRYAPHGVPLNRVKRFVEKNMWSAGMRAAHETRIWTQSTPNVRVIDRNNRAEAQSKVLTAPVRTANRSGVVSFRAVFPGTSRITWAQAVGRRKQNRRTGAGGRKKRRTTQQPSVSSMYRPKTAAGLGYVITGERKLTWQPSRRGPPLSMHQSAGRLKRRFPSTTGERA